MSLSQSGTWEVPPNAEPVLAQTAASGQDLPPAQAKQPKAKRPTVQQIANQQVAMMDLVAAITNRLDALTKLPEHTPKPVPFHAEAPGASQTAGLLQQAFGLSCTSLPACAQVAHKHAGGPSSSPIPGAGCGNASQQRRSW